MYGLYFQPFDPPPPVNQFTHPCRGRTKCDACIKFALLEDQKKETPAIMEDEKFTTEYRETLTAMNENHDPLLRKLPAEIIGQIFEVCGPFSDEQDCRLRTGAICRSWRRISWATPGVWSRITVILSAPEEPRQAELAEEWLQRSGDLPLDILVREQFVCRSIKFAPSPEDVDALAKVLNKFSHRWARLHIDGPPIHHSLFTGNEHGAGRLQFLTLTFYWFTTRNHRKTLPSDQFQLSASLPRPSNVELYDVSPSAVKIAWDHVVSVSLTSRRLEDARSILELAPQMKTLQFDVSTDPPVAMASQPAWPRITHEKLEDLTLSFVDCKWDIQPLIDSLSLPALRKFKLDGYSCCEIRSQEELERAIPFPAFGSMVARSACALEELHLHDSDYHTSELVDFLSSARLASLERLELKGFFRLWKHSLPDELFKRLAETCNDDKPFLPNLRSLSYTLLSSLRIGTIYPEEDFPWEHVVGMFGTRNHPSKRPLSRLLICRDYGRGVPLKDYNMDILDPEIARALVDLQMRPGMQLEVHDFRDSDILKKYYHQKFGIVTPPENAPRGWRMLE
ncbi:hypothetical protein CVT26_000751 [Gymnopilus dilepis]|uniref:Uncharacterized protein n=1 Tax=Gymnopilus dilepis TaxID=231916 RepID=A0A409Y2G3_9AGAR|nr:hypothetical protein CVT26_000751 [Gymnopilus dilepis]